MSQNGHQPPENTQPSAGGNGGALFGREQQVAGGIRNLRSDARLVAKLLSCGCIPESTVRKLLRQGAALAGRSATRNDARGYSACMGVLAKAVSLEQTELGMKQAAAPVINNTTVQIVQRADFYANDAHDRASEALAAPTACLEVTGTVQDASLRPEVGQNGHGANGSNGRARTNGRHPEGGS